MIPEILIKKYPINFLKNFGNFKIDNFVNAFQKCDFSKTDKMTI